LPISERTTRIVVVTDIKDGDMGPIEHALAAVMYKTQFDARASCSRRGSGPYRQKLPEDRTALAYGSPNLSGSSCCGGLLDVLRLAYFVEGFSTSRGGLAK